MLRRLRANKTGVSFLEYTVLLIVIVAVFVIMQVYIKRIIMGKWKDGADAIGFGRQY